MNSSDLFASFNSQDPSAVGGQIDTTDIPSYITAADNHNLGNVGSSWFDINPLNIPKFAAVSVVSGLNSVYNTGVKIANFFGADADEARTEDVVNTVFSGLDSDLGVYYAQNQKAADLAGFLVTSLVPGIGGIKILNAGQKALAVASDGFVGTNLGMALGLRTPAIETYIASAGKEIATGQAAFTSITSSTAKALSLGVYQNVLEGAAFETAVQATMQASPILDDQSKSDIIWNIGTAGLFGGVLGGAFSSAKTFGLIKKEAARVSGEINPIGARGTNTFVNTGVQSDKIIALTDDLEHGPVLDPGDPLYPEKVKALNARQTRIANDVRAAIHEVAGNDTDLGRMIADTNVGQSSIDTMRTFIDTDQLARVNKDTRVETAVKERVKLGLPANEDLQVAYLKLTGESAGLVTDTAPIVVNLADKLGGRAAVLEDVKAARFSVNDMWDASKATLDSSGHLQAERRQIWASELMPELKEEQVVGAYDLPVLERALHDGSLSIKLQGTVKGKTTIIKDGFSGRKELQDYIVAAKDEIAANLQISAMKGKNAALTVGKNLEEAQQATTEKIAKITNTTVGRLEATAVGAPEKDYFAWQQLQPQREKFLQSKGLSPVKGEEQDPRFLPTWAKATKIVRDKEVDGNVLDGLTYIKTMQQLGQQGVENVVTKQAPELSVLPAIKDTHLARADSLGTGAGKFTFNNPGYDSLGSIVSLIGSKIADYARDAKTAFAKASEGVLANLARNQDAVIEWSSLNQRVSRSAKQWVKYTDEEGAHYLVEANEFKGVFGKGENATHDIGDVSPEGLIEIKNDEVGKLAQAHADQHSRMYTRRNERASALGADQARNVEVEGYPLFRPIPANPKDYPFFAFVKDPRVTGQGHTSMIFAESDSKLRELTAAAQRTRPELDVWFKQDTEEFQKARQAYEYDRTLSDNYIDSSLRNEGIYSNYFAKTDPQAVVDDYIQHHARLIDTDARELVRSKYSSQFDWLEDQAKSFSRVETSKFGGNFKQLENQAKNPYLSYIKTALNLSRVQEAPLWYNINRYADQAVSILVEKVQNIWGANKTLDDAAIKEINDSLQKHGMNTGYYDAATNLLVNQSVPKAELTKFVRGANAVLSKLTLGLDPLNSLVNTLGANILRSTELKQLTDAVAAGDSEIAGKLAGLSKVDMTGAGDLVTSPTKLIAKAMKDFFSSDPAVKANHDLFERLGFQKGFSAQFRQIIGDDLALRGTETVDVLNAKLKSAISKVSDLAEAGQKYTGNKLAEEFNRFVSARTVQLLTDPAVDKGLLTRQEQYAYMNTFVNRVEGNIVASQRPFAFQGPIGQAIGLFQSYQFNLMQQMFRYVSEGSTKDAAMLLGLQGTFFGIQGLPAFQAINQHIIGTASGNPKHIDAYDAMYGIAGKNVGDILTYGLPSKLLSTNLYSRGDINPRQLTIIPTALNEVPLVGAFLKLFGSVKDTAQRIGGGANVWESLLQGIEHNGISRPLSGIAQTLQATTGKGVPFSTTSQGSIMFSNDMLSLATLSRLAGGRPLDEAIINDGIFRMHSYQLADLGKMDSLAKAVKTSNINGQEMSQDQWDLFAGEYQKSGGKQVQFNKFMVREIKAANTSGADKIISQLGSPFAQKMQLLMGDGTPTSLNSFF
jgi:hypothetical protein